MGAFSYAHDLSLLAPSLKAAQLMLGICEDYAKEYDVIFNTTKSVILLYNVPRDSTNVELKLNGNTLKQYDKATHLSGDNGKYSNSANIEKAVADIMSRTNVLLSKYSFCNTDVLCDLFHTLFTSYYGN